MDLKQFKLINGDEVICEVLEYNTEDNDMMVVTKALKIVSMDDLDQSMRYYTFKPWQLMNNNPGALHILNAYHILSQTTPSTVAVEYFNDVIKEMSEEDEPEIYLRDSSETNFIEFQKDIVH